MMTDWSRRSRWAPTVGPPGNPICNIIRLLPRHPNMADLFARISIPLGLGPRQDTAVPCLTPFGSSEPCPACRWIDRLNTRTWEEGGQGPVSAFGNQAERARPQDRFGVNVVDC